MTILPPGGSTVSPPDHPSQMPTPSSSFHSIPSSQGDSSDDNEAFHDTQAPTMSSPPPQTDSPPEDTVSDTVLELEELERAVESLPSSSDAGDDDDAASEVIVSPGAAGVAQPTSPAPSAPVVNTSAIQLDGPSPGQGPWQLEDWLRVYGQSLGVATTATSTGFNLARGATAVSLTIAKRLAQVAVALPAMALDAASGSVPGGETATASAIAHQSVGGLFDLISTLALGGIDLGSALTTAGLGAASTGVEGLRRTLGSEVVKSLGQFVKLVQREWNADNDSLPPGGLPPFGLTGVTRALTVWICIQMVTHKHYEKKMLKELDEFDIDAIRKEIDQEHREDRAHGLGGISSVKITSEKAENEGDVIGAEVGSRSTASAANNEKKPLAIEGSASPTNPAPLSEKEAVKGLLRYSSLVLAVYGGVALAWLGSLPQDDPLPPPTPSSSTARPAGSTVPQPLPADGLTREQDEEQFLLAASMMDLTEQERDEAEAQAETKSLRSTATAERVMPGGLRFDDRNSSSGQVIFNADSDIAETSVAAAAPSAAAAASPLTPSGPSQPSLASTSTDSASVPTNPQQTASSYTYLNLISGQHDEELFHRVGNLQRENVQAGSYDEMRHHHPPPPPRQGVHRPSQPRYYIVTDHVAQKVVLVLRGSLTLGDIATDLTCESREFFFPDPAARGETESGQEAQTQGETSNSVPFPAEEATTSARADKYTAGTENNDVPLVHEGMYETALLVGSLHRPVHRAVRLALEAQPGYDLDIAGHSLGAGVASLLAILWANPETTLTTAASGLPVGRRLHAYCYACPCTMSGSLSRRAQSLITTYAYSYDLVCRLSLGTIQDIRNASAWILWEDQQSRQTQRRGNGRANDDSDNGAFNPLRVPRLLTKAFEHQSGRMDADPEAKEALEGDFLALRKTLEANMTNVELYPPGQVIYLLHPRDLSEGSGKPRAFTLKKAQGAAGGGAKEGRVENIFSQIIFSRKLLSCHMPSVYDKALRGVAK